MNQGTLDGFGFPSSGTMGLALIYSIPITSPKLAIDDFSNVFSSDFDDYIIKMDGLLNTTGSDSINIRFYNSGVIDTGSNYGTSGQIASNLVISSAIGTASTVVNTGIGYCCTMNVNNVNSKTSIKSGILFNTSQSASTPTYNSSIIQFAYVAQNSISGFEIYWNGGSTFSPVGTIRVYGYKK